jgi:hypothetical protein
VNCTRDKCEKHAVWKPLLGMRTSVRGTEVIGRFRDLSLCEQHKDAALLADFLSASSWDKIVRYMREAGKPEPKRHLTTLRWEMVDSPESTETETLPF